MELAVVIPALEEAEQIAPAVQSVLSEARSGPDTDLTQGQAVQLQVWVVDGGSQDGTPQRARAAGARVLQGEPGRGQQLEKGWRVSRGEIILFLHADTRLARGWLRSLQRVLADPKVAGGRLSSRIRQPPLRLPNP